VLAVDAVVADNWSKTTAEAVRLRRWLHERPELTWQEHGTAQAIRERLDALDIGWRACADTGTIARLADRAPGRTVALRADIDALPILEQTSVDWRSGNEGCMHACGHDGHTATLLGVAAWLKTREHDLPGPVVLLFQPAEEGGHGARAMIDDGALEGVDAIFGWHNWPAIEYGRALCPDGPVMAGNGTFEITLRGRGGHASQPEACRDPVLAAAAVVGALQQVVSRRISPQAPTVLSVTQLRAEGAPTVIPETAEIGGSFRLGHADTREQVGEAIAEIAHGTAAAHGVEADVRIHPRYDATVNDRSEAARFREILQAELGDDALDVDLPTPIMASEDFSYYLKERPGAFALIGADDGNGHDHPCHSPYYDFNDRLIDTVGRIYARIAGMPVEEP
jgi:hippurate hydrolase